ESQLAEDDGIDGDVLLVSAKPRHYARIGRWFRRLAQNVGVDQILHSVSVDSESMGTKKPFCGQASSQSMAPSFCGAARRTRRYSPRSRRSTSNSCPGSTRSICRNSAGSTICPFEETVVFTESRYRLTWCGIKHNSLAHRQVSMGRGQTSPVPLRLSTLPQNLRR